MFVDTVPKCGLSKEWETSPPFLSLLQCAIFALFSNQHPEN